MVARSYLFHPNAKYNINTPQADFEINTDASENGWGATDGSNPTCGFWSENDKKYPINYLELLAIKHAVMIYEDELYKTNKIVIYEDELYKTNKTVNELYKTNKILRIADYIKSLNYLFVRGVIAQSTIPPFEGFFIQMRDTHQHNTRHAAQNAVTLNQYKTAFYGTHSIKHQSALI